jgi:hypothetical protein
MSSTSGSIRGDGTVTEGELNRGRTVFGFCFFVFLFFKRQRVCGKIKIKHNTRNNSEQQRIIIKFNQEDK